MARLQPLESAWIRVQRKHDEDGDGAGVLTRYEFSSAEDPSENGGANREACEMIVIGPDGIPVHESVLRLKLQCTAKFVESYRLDASGNYKYISTERGSRQEPGNSLFSFDIRLAPNHARGINGGCKFKFLRLNDEGLLLVKDLHVESTPQKSQNNAVSQSGKELGRKNSSPGEKEMLLTMVQMQQKMFEQKIVSLISRKFTQLQNGILSRFSGLDERVTHLEGKISSLVSIDKIEN